MKNRPPLSEGLIFGADSKVNTGWANWLSSVFFAVPWDIGFTKSATLDFGSITAQSQSELTFTVKGVRAGDAVHVTPRTDVAGIIFTGAVTANDTITIYAKNFTVSSIDPASQIFKIIAMQD